jgi:NAD(P)-dependent dehydrogenase (short-subunit alcohol dehydrogenase family)
MNDKVVLITGGAGNLGLSVTSLFLEEGARVAVPLYKTDKQVALDALASRHGGRLHTFGLDLTTERGAEQAINEVLEWGARLDSVVHLVGGYAGGRRLIDTPLDLWTRMVELNMTSAFLVARSALVPLVQGGGGTLVFVSSRSAFQGFTGNAAYSTTKAALITLAKAIAEEYGRDGVRSNVVVPDTIDTEANRQAMPNADPSRWVRPESIARVIYFLASDASRVINGAAVPVYGPG